MAYLWRPVDILGVGHFDPGSLLTLRDVTTGAHGGKQVNDEGENVTRENEGNNCRSQYAKSNRRDKETRDIPHSRIAAAFRWGRCR